MEIYFGWRTWNGKANSDYGINSIKPVITNVSSVMPAVSHTLFLS